MIVLKVVEKFDKFILKGFKYMGGVAIDRSNNEGFAKSRLDFNK